MSLKPWYNFLILVFVIAFVTLFVITNFTALVETYGGNNSEIKLLEPFKSSLGLSLVLLILFRVRQKK